MLSKFGGLRFVVLLVLFFFATSPAMAVVTPQDEYEDRLRDSQTVASLDGQSFGENISLYSGAISFRQVDINLPGIGLPIQLVRTYDVRDWRAEEGPSRAFADWRLEVPHIETLFEAFSEQSDYKGTFFSGNRCSGFAKAPTISMNTGLHSSVRYTAENWWGGYQLVIPNVGSQDLLLRDASNSLSPKMYEADGTAKSFSIVTKQQWMISCLQSTSNGLSGQAFLVVSPDGTKYWMDWLVYRPYPELNFTRTRDYAFKRKMAMMMVSRVEDRFGNSLQYQYDGSGNLIKIQASDGRAVTINYESWQGANTSTPGNRIVSATLQASDTPTRTWKYGYQTSSDSRVRLASVYLPDNSNWSIDFSGFTDWQGSPSVISYYPNACAPVATQNSGTKSGTVRHPSGAVATFVLGSIVRGRSHAEYVCNGGGPNGEPSYLKKFNLYTVNAILGKTISGPGISPQKWSYSYSGPNNSWEKDCNSGCTNTVSTDVTDPSGATSRYISSNRLDYSEGQLLRIEEYNSAVGSPILRATDFSYSAPESGPWPRKIGTVFLDIMNDGQASQISPPSRKTINQAGTVYEYLISSFDNFGRPVASSRYSPWYARKDSIEYYDDYSKWILGNKSKATNDDTGAVESKVVYDANAMPKQTWSFGRLLQTLNYNGDGTLANIVDANNGVTNFYNWKRGVPQSILFPDNSSVSATVNDYGLITSLSDENGYLTGYSYDVMGRLVKVSYQGNDVTNWNDTNQALEQIASVEYGLPADHWRRTVSIGNYRKVTYFDALLRPVLTREFDLANEGSSQRYQRFSYDYAGRLKFASYPSDTAQVNTGVWSDYDALGRKVVVSQDSGSEALKTVTEYLPGNQVRVTDPRGNTTLTGYQIFDKPAYDIPVWVQHPEGGVTEIARDIFGKPVSVRRRDANGVYSLTRSYVYDAYQQLCKTVEPETGAIANGYDAVGNMVWSAAGLALPSTTSCDADAAFASGRRVDRSYDVRNRIRSRSFPDGNGNQAWIYWPDGAVKQITTLNNGVATYNSYAYNKRRLLIAESQGQADGETWALGYAYDANGNLAAHRYPSGQTVDYAPNALGQPTKAGSYATGVSYYPNGAIKQFTYGNGIVHTLTQNARQLPDTSQDAYGGTAFLNDGYDYDANGNVAGISDGATGRNQRGNRTMTYDGMDRLIKAESPMFGTATYSYDVLDNLTHVVAPGRDHYYCYDASWQLTNVKTGGCGGSTVIGMSYDPQGNLSNKNGQAFVFDYGNRLRQATGKETYRYDGNGRRTLALQSAGNIGSLYDQSGALRFQRNQRQSKSTDYILLGGSLVAEADWPLGQLASVKDYVNWNPVSGATRYVVEESVDGVTWTSVYDGNQGNWTSLARPAGTYSYRVTACTADGNCTAASNVTHDQRPAVDIVPLLYQLLLNG